MDKRASEQNAQELIIAGKIINSILLGLMCGFLAYFAFNRIVIALVAAPIAGGLLIGVFFAHELHRKTIASILGLCVLFVTILAVMVRIESESYASFFAYLGGFAGVIAVLALLAVVGLNAQASNSNVIPAATEGNSGTAIVCVGTLVVSLVVWFISSTVSESLKPPEQQVVVVNPNAEIQQSKQRVANQAASTVSQPPVTTTIQTQVAPALIPSSTIPVDVTYTVIKETKLPGIKRVVEIRLNKRVSEDTLTLIAKTVKASDSRNYERTFVGYYLPYMVVDRGYWASTHYKPNLEVRILGLSADAAATLSAKPEASTRDEIGRWLDDSPNAGHRIVIFRDSGKLFMELTGEDGSSGTTEIVESQTSGRGRRFSNLRGSTSGDHWLLESDGHLQIRDNQGLIYTDEKIR